MESLAPCPTCYATVDSRAIVCPHCRFELGKYVDNWRRRGKQEMRKVPGRVRSTWGSNYGKNVGETIGVSLLKSLGAVLAGALFALIPILGWFLAVGFWFWAVWYAGKAILAPLLGVFTTKSTFNKVQREVRASNTYTDIICPSCNRHNPSKVGKIVNWPNEQDGHIVCQYCSERVLRNGDALVWVPFPAISVRGSYKEFFTESPGDFVIAATGNAKSIEKPR
jgi:DNA-directed RNA polymerase subunit RPC12/RpoP